MPDEDQERVEDYLEIQRYIEQLQAGDVAHLPEQMTPEQARIYRMAALFHLASPQAEEDAMPHPRFVEQLEARLLSQLPPLPQLVEAQPDAALNEQQGEAFTHTVESPAIEESPQQEQPPLPVPTATRNAQSRKRALLSRRNLLTGAATVAASLGIGVGVGYTVERVGGNESSTGQTKAINKFTWDPETPLVGEVPKTWLRVVSLAQLEAGAVRFVTDALVGYVVHLTKGSDNTKDEVIALSAACTHMGCLVQWQNTDRRFHCPCHNGLFEASGEQVDQPGYAHYLAPLPRLNTKVENGDVYVEVPAKTNAKR